MNNSIIVQFAVTADPEIKISEKNGDWVLEESSVFNSIDEIFSGVPLFVLRQKRDQLLSETDWWCVSDRTPTQAQLDYRQALRDLPANSTPALDESGQLTGVQWPVKPA